MIGIIGGTGLQNIDALNIIRESFIDTPYGKPSDKVVVGKLENRDVVFLPRHGNEHTVPPHLINYRANIYALKSLGIEAIFAVATVGSIPNSNNPGSNVIPHQIIDYTYGREHTFFDGITKPVSHIDFTNPYSSKLRELLCANANLKDINFV